MKTVKVISSITTSVFCVSMQKSFTRMTTTPLKSRTLRPNFGSRMHELIDKVMDERWKLLFKKYLFECFFDENNEPWDKRFKVRSVDIVSIDILTGSVRARINFEGFEIETQMGGF
ncbi:baseplate assembly protein [Malaciobacter mytili LMG 24559]|uniref:Baseplate assembly protein n=1 Tax=Malaciobacter mytili LMG 24559 TaxID=1032238 RepID=A0AAX2AKH0_9BACT|nr:baseplate assembly protein [Malaciobacter mytili]AXH14373.1 phage baseplate assembly protein W [Malaciobacter mytili LMG 24559]RXK16051.1 baseplate assembly protein [Malaciobacter mytili LMG 24559]